MRNMDLIIILMALLLLAACSNSSLFYSEDESRFNAWTMEMKASSEIATANNIAKWMKSNMQYKADGLIDYFRPLLKAWRQQGDCEDFAVVGVEAMSRLGSKAEYLTVWTKIGGHTVCLITLENGRYCHIGNWGYHGSYQTLDQVIYGIYPDWVSCTIRNRKQKITKTITRP